jgi:hypothetical protein
VQQKIAEEKKIKQKIFARMFNSNAILSIFASNNNFEVNCLPLQESFANSI